MKKTVTKKREKPVTHEIIYYGHETLKKVADEVMNIDGPVVELIDSMFNVMYRSKGIGLAAPQVNESLRIITVDASDDTKSVIVELVNPVIKEFSDEDGPYDEGCLSLPGLTGEVFRPLRLMVAGYNRDGSEVEFEADGLLARVIQHEVDHLNGILFIDRLEDYMRNEMRPELKKIKKLNKRS
ncbi:MAG: peptide deformylase [Spirochaetes bacterium]|nr:peptide deformylase [Spirochaetota bacterium]